MQQLLLCASGINLSGVLSDEERFANIELFRSLCAQSVCTSVFALRIEDFFFASKVLKNNFLALLCEVLSHVDPISVEQKFSSAGITEKPPMGIATVPAEFGKAASHHQQPLLSKRSKKQLAKMEAAITKEEQKSSQNNGMDRSI